MRKFLQQKTWLLVPLLLLSLLLLQGCGNRYAEQVQGYHADAVKVVSQLKQQLDRNQLSNAVLVKTYADTLIQTRPELNSVAQLLKKDATSSGGMYQNFANRLKSVNQIPEREEDFRLAIEELNNITVGSDPAVFNDGLLDLVNTLADLSQGELARVNVPKGETAQNLKDSTGVVPGSYLVGNPNYGNFRQNSSGKSFWEWYGQYALISNLVGLGGGYGFSRGPIYADAWYRQPRHSYYNDYGRSAYGSQKARNNWKNTEAKLGKKGITPAKPKKDFRSAAGKRRMSTYAYQRQANNKQYGAKTKQQAANAPPKGSGANKTKRSSAFSFFKPSSRGTSSGSRSFRSGK
ncbi:MAG: hypothetical protein GXP19_08775 [Gammaproteobacteria bacterium]|nr:hypothetical protein [Gammaproteobacteria bacterium]